MIWPDSAQNHLCIFPFSAFLYQLTPAQVLLSLAGWWRDRRTICRAAGPHVMLLFLDTTIVTFLVVSLSSVLHFRAAMSCISCDGFYATVMSGICTPRGQMGCEDMCCMFIRSVLTLGGACSLLQGSCTIFLCELPRGVGRRSLVSRLRKEGG